MISFFEHWMLLHTQLRSYRRGRDTRGFDPPPRKKLYLQHCSHPAMIMWRCELYDFRIIIWHYDLLCFEDSNREGIPHSCHSMFTYYILFLLKAYVKIAVTNLLLIIKSISIQCKHLKSLKFTLKKLLYISK